MASLLLLPLPLPTLTLNCNITEMYPVFGGIFIPISSTTSLSTLLGLETDSTAEESQFASYTRSWLTEHNNELKISYTYTSVFDSVIILRAPHPTRPAKEDKDRDHVPCFVITTQFGMGCTAFRFKEGKNERRLRDALVKLGLRDAGSAVFGTVFKPKLQLPLADDLLVAGPPPMPSVRASSGCRRPSKSRRNTEEEKRNLKGLEMLARCERSFAVVDGASLESDDEIWDEE